LAGNDIILATIAGGTASELTGGKFINGAVTGAAAAVAAGAMSGGFTIRKSLTLVKILAVDAKAFIVGQGFGTMRTLYDDLKDIGSALYRREFGKAGISILKTAWNTALPKYDWTGGSGWGGRQYYDKDTGLWSKDPQTHQGKVAASHDLTGDHWQWVIDSWTPSVSNLPTGPIGLAYQLLGTVPFAVVGGVQRAFGQ